MRIKEEKASQKTSVMWIIWKFFIFGMLPFSVISNCAQLSSLVGGGIKNKGKIWKTHG